MLLSVGYFVGYVYGCCVLKQALFFNLKGFTLGFFFGGGLEKEEYIFIKLHTKILNREKKSFCLQ